MARILLLVNEKNIKTIRTEQKVKRKTIAVLESKTVIYKKVSLS